MKGCDICNIFIKKGDLSHHRIEQKKITEMFKKNNNQFYPDKK
jgi:hypothetical protein